MFIDRYMYVFIIDVIFSDMIPGLSEGYLYILSGAVLVTPPQRRKH